MIIEGRIGFLPLIGRPSFDELGMLRIDETRGLKEPNKAMKKVQNENPELKKILHRYAPLTSMDTCLHKKVLIRAQTRFKLSKIVHQCKV